MKVVLVDCLIYQGLLRYQRRRAAGSPDRDEPITIRMKRAQYPGLISVFEAFRGKDLIFSRDDIELLCLELITRELPVRGADGWLDDCTPESLVEILWNVGFLGAETSRNGGARHIRAASFLGPHQASEPTVIAAQRFRIHPMFWFYLGNQVAPGQQIPRR